jgi:class 3 adenylate cyclase
MVSFDAIREPEQHELLVAFQDLTGFARWSRKKSDAELFVLMEEHFAEIGRIADGAEGRLIKPIGDAALLVFPDADEGVEALLAMKDAAEARFAEYGFKTEARTKVHWGPVVMGRIGPMLDVYGQTVNTAATLASFGISLSPQAFRKLSKPMRERFKKHTPPVRYIALSEAHRD